MRQGRCWGTFTHRIALRRGCHHPRFTDEEARPREAIMFWRSVCFNQQAIKKVERWRIDTVEWWRWRRLLTVPWTARITNQTILKEINTEFSLERLMLKLNLQYFGHLTQRADSLEKTLKLGKIEWKVLSCVQLFVTPWTIQSLEFSRLEYWT